MVKVFLYSIICRNSNLLMDLLVSSIVYLDKVVPKYMYVFIVEDRLLKNI